MKILKLKVFMHTYRRRRVRSTVWCQPDLVTVFLRHPEQRLHRVAYFIISKVAGVMSLRVSDFASISAHQAWTAA